MPEPKVCVGIGMFHIQPLLRDTLQWLAFNPSPRSLLAHIPQTPVKRQLWASCGLQCQMVEWRNQANQIQEERERLRSQYFYAVLPLFPKHRNTVRSSNLLNPINVKQLIFTCSAWAARMPAVFTPSTSVTVWEELNKHTLTYAPDHTLPTLR